uniref:Myosin heavy chain-related protein n=1 Tax=Angiostrongylus cantonensis TaxID=6313 RepID=A0A0K0CVM1_ANGCA
MENVSLEQRLAQKIMSMENAAARISAVRAELKTNTDQTRKDVKAVISEQMLLLRAREQELMNELDMISSGRESALEYQQHSLYTLIGECKRLVRNLKESDGSSTYAASMISRLSFVDDVDEDWAHVSFESDAIGLQSSLSSFGTIHATMSNHINEAKNTIEKNLLMEIEDSDNNAVMAQKPVLAKKSSENPKKVGKQQVETVRKWLKETSLDSAAALDPDITSALVEYDFIKVETFLP